MSHRRLLLLLVPAIVLGSLAIPTLRSAVNTTFTPVARLVSSSKGQADSSATADRPPPPEGQPSRVTHLGPDDAVDPDARPKADRPGERLAAERARRKARGSDPISAQVAQLARDHKKSQTEVEGRGQVVVTLKTSMPWDVYKAQQAGDGRFKVPDAAQSVGLYMELDDGYPFTVYGSPTADLQSQLRAWLEHAAVTVENAATNSPPRHTGDALASMNAQGMRDALRNFNDKTVVLGFVMPIKQFREEEARLRKDLGVWAEVTLEQHESPFKPIDQILTADRVREFRAVYASRS